MIQVRFSYQDYSFESVKEEDLECLAKWIKDNDKGENINNCSLDPQIFYRRFLEYYITDDETFIKVTKNNKVVAVFKGRFEEKRNKELIIWLFIMDKESRNRGNGALIIKKLIEHFRTAYSVNKVEVLVMQGNENGISFWNSLGFETSRVTKNFFEINDNKRNLVVMKQI